MAEEIIRQENVVNQVNNGNFEEKSLSLRDIINIIRKHLIAIIVFMLVGIGAGVGYTVIEPEEYIATATIMASPDVINTTTAAEYNGMSMLAETFVSFVKEKKVIDTVVEELSKTYEKVTPKIVSSGLTVSNDNLIIRLTYSSSDPDMSVDFVNAFVDGVVKISNLPEGVDSSGNPLRDNNGNIIYKYKLLGGNLEGLSPADIGTKKSHTIKNVGIGFAIGAVIAFLYVVVFELLDNSFRSEQELEQELNLPILSTIPFYDIDGDNKKKGGRR